MWTKIKYSECQDLGSLFTNFLEGKVDNFLSFMTVWSIKWFRACHVLHYSSSFSLNLKLYLVKLNSTKTETKHYSSSLLSAKLCCRRSSAVWSRHRRFDRHVELDFIFLIPCCSKLTPLSFPFWPQNYPQPKPNFLLES
jgi:hypothetical protein